MFFALLGLVNGQNQVPLKDLSLSKVYFKDTKDNKFVFQAPDDGYVMVNLWGAGGAGGAYKKAHGRAYAGGGGAFVSCYLSVDKEDSLQFRVGKGGSVSGYNNDVTNNEDRSAGMSQSLSE
jgi:hypothetical protein